MTMFKFSYFYASSACTSTLLDMIDFSDLLALGILSSLFFKFFSFSMSLLFRMSSSSCSILSITLRSSRIRVSMLMKNLYNSLAKSYYPNLLPFE